MKDPVTAFQIPLPSNKSVVFLRYLAAQSAEHTGRIPYDGFVLVPEAGNQ